MNWIYGAIAAAVLAITGTGAYKFAEYKTQASAGAEQVRLTTRIGELEQTKHDLELVVAEQNKAVELAKAESDAADRARLAAEANAAKLAAYSKGRMDKLQAALDAMAGSAEVLERYWELRQ